MHDLGALDVDADITRARGLPPSWYVAPAALERELATLFPRTWSPIAHTSELAAVGAYVTATFGRDPVLVVRASETELRAYLNVCPHRAGPVAKGCGRRKLLQCGYHGWTFALTGELVRAPESDGCDLSGVTLRRISVETWGPLVFAAVDPIVPLAQLLAGIASPDPSLVRVLARDYELEANWKVYVDNYLEGYHIPLVHPRLHAELDDARYRTVTSRWSSRQHAPLRAAGGSSRVYRDVQDEDADYHWVFPTLMTNAYQGLFQTNVVVPLSPTRTRVRFEWLAPTAISEDEPRFRELVEFSELVQEEDRAICETVQRNLASSGAQPARYVPSRENGVHHFHRLYAEMMR